MLKTFATATAVSALMISGAFAQTTQPAPSTTAPSATPATPAPATDTTKKSESSASGPQFIAAQKSDQWLASKFNGTDVMGPNNEKIGDVNDLLFQKDGKLVGVIVGVGGFLGIGQKDVAIDMSAFQMVPGSNANDPNDVKLKVSWTKDQLKAAPSFEKYKAPARTTNAPGSSNTGTRAPAGAPSR